MGKRRSWLPKSIHIDIEIDDDDPHVAHVRAAVDGEKMDLGSIYPMIEVGDALPGDVEWMVSYGSACHSEGELDTANGPMAALGTLIDNALDEDAYGAYEESDEDEADDLGDLEDEASKRSWKCVAENTFALEVRSIEGSLRGCLVRYEDDGNWPTVMFVPGVSLADLEYEG